MRTFRATARERLAVTPDPFRSYIDSLTNSRRKPSVAGMKLKAFPAIVVEKFGVRTINPLTDDFRSTDGRYTAEFREAVDEAGTLVGDLGFGGRYFYDPDASTAVDYGCKGIDITVQSSKR